MDALGEQILLFGALRSVWTFGPLLCALCMLYARLGRRLNFEPSTTPQIAKSPGTTGVGNPTGAREPVGETEGMQRLKRQKSIVSRGNASSVQHVFFRGRRWTGYRFLVIHAFPDNLATTTRVHGGLLQDEDGAARRTERRDTPAAVLTAATPSRARSSTRRRPGSAGRTCTCAAAPATETSRNAR